MAKKKRPDPAPQDTGSSEPFHSPFASLGGLRAKLPEGEASVHEPSARVPEELPGMDDWLRHKLVVRHERKGHGGKTVTRLEGLGGGDVQRDALARRLAKALGCGARVDADAIVLSGDLRTRLVAWLNAQGAQRVVTGS